jgi:hypothetical protein
MMRLGRSGGLNAQWKYELTQDLRAIHSSLRDFLKFGL